MLLRAFSDLSSEAQVIISTHTPILARALPDSSLRYIHIREDKGRDILTGGAETNRRFAQSLGVLPDNTVKLFIGVEGPNDITFLQTISAALRDDGIDVPDLEKMELNGELIFFPLGGSNLSLWSSRLENLNRPEFHLCDRDVAPPAPPKYQGHIEAVNQRQNCRARSTSKKEIENYLHRNAIIAAYQELTINLAVETNFASFDDVPCEIARLVHEASESTKAWNEVRPEEQGKKESRAKRILCSSAPKFMNRALLNEIDPDGNLLQWFDDIRNLLA
jgi:hypothetical protein